MISSSDFLKFASELGYAGQVAWAKEAASRSTWNSPQSRGGTRPLRVDTMLRKEKDGTLVKLAPKPKEDEEKSAMISASGGPAGTDYSEPGQDPGSARLQKPTIVPSREDMAGGVRREDTRDFATTLPAAGVFLNDTGPQPGYIKTGAMPALSSEAMEHLTDVGGLGLMAAGSASKLYGQLANKGEGPLSGQTQRGLDLAGLGMMAAPTVAALGQLAKGHAGHGLAGGGSKFVNIANLAGLGALAIPTADKIQAHLRAKGEEDPEKKMLLGHGAHKALELGGYGALVAGSAADAIRGVRSGEKVDWTGKALQGLGYGALAVPTAVDMKEGPARTALELGGLGALAAPSIKGMVSHSH